MADEWTLGEGVEGIADAAKRHKMTAEKLGWLFAGEDIFRSLPNGGDGMQETLTADLVDAGVPANRAEELVQTIRLRAEAASGAAWEAYDQLDRLESACHALMQARRKAGLPPTMTIN